MLATDVPVLLHNSTRGLLSLDDGRLDVLQLSSDGRPPKRLLSSPMRLVLRARLADDAPNGSSANGANGSTNGHVNGNGTASAPRRLDLHALRQKNANSHALHLTKIHVLVEQTHLADAEAFVEAVMAAAYPVTTPFRKVLLLVNPVGGKGKAKSIVKETVLPILEAAGCLIELQETQYRNHAEEIAKTMELKYDVIATASGDGIICEVLNGLAERPDGKKALRTPIAPLPTGSACACSTNLFGIQDTFNIALAALNVVKGQHLPIDLASILLLPEKKRRVSFLSIAVGMMVDLDFGTEHLRWMGDTRFIYGYVRGVVQSKNYKMRMRFDVTNTDKEAMARAARDAARADMTPLKPGERRDSHAVVQGPQTASASSKALANGSIGSEDDGPIAPHVPLQPNDSWVTIESNTDKRLRRGSTSPPTTPGDKMGGWQNGDSLSYFYAGLMPWVSRDLNCWPVVLPGSGEIDMVVQRVISRKEFIAAIDGAEHGDGYWADSQCYYKLRAFTVENLDKEGTKSFSLDGEQYPFNEFHVEVMPRAATLLSLDGRFTHGLFVSGTNKKGKLNAPPKA